MEKKWSGDPGREIARAARKTADAAGRPVKVLGDGEARNIAAGHGLSMNAVYRSALSLGICPMRYLRNRESITLSDQLRLSTKTAAVIGAGGLGGNIVLMLARIGVGALIVVDPDAFDETNLNRQALSGTRAIGVSKVRAAAETVEDVNPGVEVICHQAAFTHPEGLRMLHGADVIIDALDNIADRIALQDAASDLGVPFVHGAIAGFEGQVMTVLPGDPGLRRIYGKRERPGEKTERPEALLGTPAPAPTLIAALEVMEVVKILLGRDGICRNQLLYVDMETGRMEKFALGGPSFPPVQD